MYLRPRGTSILEGFSMGEMTFLKLLVLLTAVGRRTFLEPTLGTAREF